jgi:hypothetical protein
MELGKEGMVKTLRLQILRAHNYPYMYIVSSELKPVLQMVTGTWGQELVH